MSTNEGLLAIDAGTGSARALLFDTEGKLLAQAAREWHHQPVDGHPGGTTFDTDQGWQAVVDSIRDVLAQVEDVRVLGIAPSSMREGFVLYDGAGKELWACPNTDGRARQEADDLVREGIADEIYRLSGDWVSITAPARMRWIARHQPEVLQQARHLGMLSDWVATKLSGEYVTDPVSYTHLTLPTTPYV